jgi:hypothetical protein
MTCNRLPLDDPTQSIANPAASPARAVRDCSELTQQGKERRPGWCWPVPAASRSCLTRRSPA